MSSRYLFAGFVLAGLSVAHPMQNGTNSQPTQIVAPRPTVTSSLAHASTVKPLDAQLSKGRHHHNHKRDDSTGIEWGEVAAQGINAGLGAVDTIFDSLHPLFDRPDKEYSFVTVTTTATASSSQAPLVPTTTASSSQAPLVPTTTASSPESTQTVVGAPGGCYYYDADGKLAMGACFS